MKRQIEIPSYVSLFDLTGIANHHFPGTHFCSIKVDGGIFFDNMMVLEPADYLAQSTLVSHEMKDGKLIFGVKPPRLEHILQAVRANFQGKSFPELTMTYVPGRVIENLIVAPRRT